MEFLDIAKIVFVCTAVNHLGLVTAVESAIKHKMPVVNCVKCLTFWAMLMYGCYCIATDRTSAATVLAISFLSAWSAIWLDLAMGIIDKLYLKIYVTLYSATNETNTDTLGSDDTMPDVPPKNRNQNTNYRAEGRDCNKNADKKKQ